MERFFSYRVVKSLCFFLIFWLMSSSLLFSPIRAQNETEEDVISIINQGIESYHNNQFQDSIAFLKSAIDKLSEKAENQQKLAEAYLFLGKCFIINNDVSQAKDAFRKALKINPELTLDAMQDSPKIMEPFLQVKEQILKEKETEQATPIQSDVQPVQPEIPEKDVDTSPVLSDLSSDDEPKKEKKWYKKWWVWTAGVVVIGGVALAMGGGSGGDDDDGPATVNVNWYP